MNVKTLSLACGLAVCLLAQTAVAGPLEDGWSAYNSSDYATALKLWRPLAEQGSAPAQHNLGVMYDRSQGVPQDYAEAVKWYRLAADQGDAKAQSKLGLMYANGRGVPLVNAEAVKWYRKAADQGDAPAQSNLGFIYENGQGVPQDYAEAVKWYRLAADQGNAYAQNQSRGYVLQRPRRITGLCASAYVVQSSRIRIYEV